MITGRLYDQLKFLAQILLPAVGTLYFALAAIWDLPAAEEVVGTIVAVDAFLGVLLGLSQVQYGKQVVDAGVMRITETETGKNYSLELEQDPEDLVGMEEARFRVDSGSLTGFKYKRAKRP